MADKADDDRVYRVVINVEEQYSIWPSDRDVPAGWTPVESSGPGAVGSKQECLDYIDKVWTDMRPLSLRKAMDSASKRANGEG